MGRIAKTCPRCHRRVEPGQRCGCTPPPKRAPRKREGEPWRAEYGGAGYRSERQTVIASQGGRCAGCGIQAARLDADGMWRVTVAGAGVHHLDPLRSGGASSAGSMAFLCPRCHNAADAALRRRDRGF